MDALLHVACVCIFHREHDLKGKEPQSLPHTELTGAISTIKLLAILSQAYLVAAGEGRLQAEEAARRAAPVSEAG